MKYWKEGYFPVILIVLNIVLTLLIFDPRLFTGGDNVTFMVVAKSLLSGQGYRDLSQPDTPFYIGSPPGYPILLMTLMAVFGQNLIIFKLASLALSCLNLVVFYKLLGMTSPDKLLNKLACLIPLVAFNILYPNQLELSDVLFTTFSVSSLYFFLKGSFKWEIWGILMGVLATYTRYAGIVLVIAMVVHLMLRMKFKRSAGYALLALLLISPWAVLALQHGFSISDIFTSQPYSQERPLLSAGEWISRIISNFGRYFLNIIPVTIFSVREPPLVLGWISTIVLLTGMLLRSIGLLGVLEIYLFLYFGLFLSWPPQWGTVRYIYPIVYFLIFYSLYPLAKLAGKKFLLAAAAALVAYSLYSLWPEVKISMARKQAYMENRQISTYPEDWQAFFICGDWIKANLSSQAIIVSRKPNMLYFQTGNQGFVYPLTPNRDLVYQKVRQADYVLVDRFNWTTSTRQYLLPALREHHEEFKVVYHLEGTLFYILKVQK
jgi:hypothetical protein